MKFAAIDIGSNAVRLLLTKVIETESGPFFRKECLVRMPIRLGEDTFTTGRISKEKVEKLVECLLGFKHLISAYSAIDFLACATSATRDAANRGEIVDLVRDRVGIDLEVVDGSDEARIIVSNHVETEITGNGGSCYLYVDVGGGSTEITVSDPGSVIASKSFDIGAVRLLHGLVPEESWRQMRKWLRQHTRQRPPKAAIGTGGNVNKIFRLVRCKEGKPLSYKKMLRVYKSLQKFTVEERVTRLNLRPDRADVIVPACQIYLFAMKWAGVRKMYVPQIGLADGLVHILYDRHRENAPSGRHLVTT